MSSQPPQPNVLTPDLGGTNITHVATTIVAASATSQNQSNPQQQTSQTSNKPVPPAQNTCAPNVVTIPVPILQNEDTFAYVTVKGSLHDRSCAVFGLNEAESQALNKRFENAIKPVVNGIMVAVPPMLMLNTLAQLSYKVICSCGEAEICWTLQREI